MSRGRIVDRLKARFAGPPPGRESTEWLRSLEGRGMKLDLDNMRALLDALGRPQVGLPAIHVAGTNGKGSVSRVAEHILREAGHKVGTYTSPHLVTFRERIRVDGVPMPREAVDAGVAALRPLVEEVEAKSGNVITYFEALTALAFWWFRKSDVDVAVVEVGLGGRLDATNVLDRPVATTVTNVTREHVDVLGTDVEGIAAEKAAIARRGVPLITAAEPPALGVLEERAEVVGAPLWLLGRDFQGEAVEATPKGQELLLITPTRDLGVVETPLLGAHQVANVALAAAAVEAAHAAGLEVDDDAFRRGIRSARVPGRLTWMKSRPAVLFDAAHNPAASRALARYLEETELKPTVVFGCLERKEWGPMVEALAPYVAGAIVTAPPTPEAADPAGPARSFSRAGVVATVVPDVGHALATARGQAGEDGVILVTGSFYLVGAAMRKLGWEPE